LQHRCSFTIAPNDHIIDAELFNDAIIAQRRPIRVRDIGRAIPVPPCPGVMER
jgi:hypothetical protein